MNGLRCDFRIRTRCVPVPFNSLILQQHCQLYLVFPFPLEGAVIGRVNPELYALGSGTWNLEESKMGNCKQSQLEDWVQNYVNVLCVNSWQVKRYIDVYSASSMIGFSAEDLLHISDVYEQAMENWSHIQDLLSYKNDSCRSLLPGLTRQINAYFNFLSNVSELARSKWTEFNLKMMGLGLGIMLVSLFIMLLSIDQANSLYAAFLPSSNSGISFGSVFTFFIVAIHAFSLFSNSYILEEGKVASFLLATTGIVKLRSSIMKKKMLFEAVLFLLLISILRLSIEVGLSKQAATSLFMSSSPSWMLGIGQGNPIWAYMSEVAPILAILLLAWLLHRATGSFHCLGIWKYIIMATISSYVLIAVQWGSESAIPSVALLLQGVGKSYIPKLVYAIGLSQLIMAVFGQLCIKENYLDRKWSLISKTVAVSSALSSTIILLSGKQGSLFALASIIGGYCITKLGSVEEEVVSKNVAVKFDPLAVTQWNLLAVCLFFATGHWCAFDGLRYGAAFIGFDEFILVRQAIFLTLDTFGFSHILPIFALPFLAVHQSSMRQTGSRSSMSSQLSQMYMMFSLITATTVTATIVCVTIQRRHLMVWGLFAPKFVFDVVGLLLTDLLICLALAFYSGRSEEDDLHRNQVTEK